MSPNDGVKGIKCVVWDLDDTLWNGVLLEGDVRLRTDASKAVRTLDERGILQSIASHNDHDAAMAELRRLGLAEFFLYPQIDWDPKSSAMKTIAERLNLSLDTFAFVDDQAYERDEVGYAHPQVLRIDAGAPFSEFLAAPRFQARFMNADSSRRRLMYMEDMARQVEEKQFEGPAEAFLASLNMRLTIALAGEDDLQRAEELTVRTHQLNSTGYTYSYGELDQFRRSPDHLLLVADLRDKFGAYGRIGLALVERRCHIWVLKLLIVSCRVMTRGIGAILLADVMRRAHGSGCRLRAEFRDTERNRVMHVTYRFAGFQLVEEHGDAMIFEHDLRQIPAPPGYISLTSYPDIAPRIADER